MGGTQRFITRVLGFSILAAAILSTCFVSLSPVIPFGEVKSDRKERERQRERVTRGERDRDRDRG